MQHLRTSVLLLLLFALAFPALAQKRRTAEGRPASASLASEATYPAEAFSSLKWRSIGPYRGGRASSVTGVPGEPNLYYMGATGGGVWRTKDGGQTWENISDGFFGGSIGAVAVSQSDPNTLYVGGGEVTVRGNVSYGYGMWKSIDGGKNWRQIGLAESRHIPRVRIHPRNPDLVYAAVLGDLYKSSEQRGVYRSKDGGESWERILFANADAGAVELVMDPNNPRVLFASTWRVRRTPYSLESGGEGSALWRSTDGGDTWENISGKSGLPKGLWGISGVDVSAVDGNRIYAIIENENGGVYRSDDQGDTWRKVNSDRSLRQRAWYYSKIYADPQDIDGVYVMNVAYHHSTDGGRTFKASNAPHGDHHDLWIAPEDNQRMVIADDGGAQVSFDGGENWSTYHNQPTAQFYRVVTDNHFPYRIYGAQQDNSTVRIPHRTDGRYIGESDWEDTAGGESAHLAPDPEDPEIVYGGSYGGLLTRVNHRTKQVQAVNVWPDNPMGYGAEGMKYRFQWNFPIFFSPNDPNKLYTASNHLHVSTNGGQSWEIISPDLTRADPDKLGSSGGPITKDNTGVEYYATIFAAAESAREPGLLWAGSDDGLVHISRDGGENWSNVTPGNIPEWTMINSIEVDPHADGTMYFAGTRYKLGDYTPYLYKTSNYGQTWQRIDGGIPRDEFTRVVRVDPARPGLLYAGTEKGMYISFDDGANWQSFQLNLPTVPITDLAIKEHNLIAATQGRSFWLIDDLTPLHQLDATVAAADWHLFKPVDAWRLEGSGGRGRSSKTAGDNHPGGVNFHYFLKEALPDSVVATLSIYEADGDLVRSWSTDADDRSKELELKTGGNVINWDMSYPDGVDFDGMILWWAGVSGPKALPGEYTVELKVGEEAQRRSFVLKADPRSEATLEDLRAQFVFMTEVRDKVSEAHEAIIDIRALRQQINDVKQRFDAETQEKLVAEADSIVNRLTRVEEALYQTRNRSGQDPLNYPIQLTNKLAHLNSLTGIGDFRPTEQAYAVKQEMEQRIDAELAKYLEVINVDIPQLNELIRENRVDVIQTKDDPSSSKKKR